MNGDQAIAKILKAEGVEWLSCFPAQTLIDEASKEGIRPILCRQERAGVNMADGYSRVNNGKKNWRLHDADRSPAPKTPSVAWPRATRTPYPSSLYPAATPARARAFTPTSSQCPTTKASPSGPASSTWLSASRR